ncbi:restriction endonuclease subunit S [Micromonospora sp. NPDC005305]|uniref:restriction endonuclease subunit S n=1 Tax=Micromonospora sp. NPDC005305 TaxID=3156875 RepID=UPI0033BD6354
MFQDLKLREGLVCTDIPWLPHVPIEWPLVRLKRLLHESKQLVGEGWSTAQLLALTKRGIIDRDMDNLEGKIPTSFAGYQIVEPSDLVFCLFDIDETPRTVGMATQRGMITAAYTRFKVLEGVLPRFLELLFASLDDRKLLRPLYTGLRKTIRPADLVASFIPLPSIGEQQAIVTYLAHAHKRINEAISAKRRLIALMEEQKRVLVNRIVMRGFEADNPVVDSGIPWIGAIPAHWELLPARYLFRPVTRPVDHPDLPQLSLTRAAGLIISGAEGSNTKAAEESRNLQECVQGDFVLNKYRAHLGLFRWCRDPGLVTRNYTVLVPTTRVDRDYFEYLFLDPVFSDGLRINARGVGEGMSPLYTATLMSMKMPVPPLGEQRAIVDRIRAETAPIDAAVYLAGRELKLLDEFKVRLTADVVTGRLDVRDTHAKSAPIDLDEAFAAVEPMPDDEGDGVMGDDLGDA